MSRVQYLRKRGGAIRGLSNKPSILFWLIVAIAVAIAIKPLVKLFDSIVGKDGILGRLGSSPDDLVKKDIADTLQPVATRMTFDMNMAKQLAIRLHTAMNPGSLFSNSATMDGTDEDEIFRVFEYIKNSDDIRAVYHAFGMQPYDLGIFTRNNKDLRGWLREELSDSDFLKIQSKLSLL